MLKEAGLSLPQQPPLIPQPPSSKSFWKKVPKWIYGCFSFLLACLAVVGLLPHLSASASPPSDLDNILNSQFTVSNDGPLKLTHVRTGCFVWNTSIFPPGPNGAHAVYLDNPYGDVSDLASSDSVTVPCSDKRFMTFGNVFGADIAIVVYYHPWPFTFIDSNRIFRFVSRRTRSSVTWDKQPPAPLEKEIPQPPTP